MNAKTPLAQQALQIHDEQGEHRMLEFLQNNVAPTDLHNSLRAQDQAGQYLLTDKTSVYHEPGRYGFHWTVINRRIQPEDAQRPTTVDPGQCPVYALESTAMFDWPNSHTIWKRIMMNIEGEALEEDQDNEVPTLSPNQSYIAAPHLYQAISQAIQHYDLPDYLLEILEQEAIECADKIYEDLDPNERKQLLQATGAALRQRSQEGPAETLNSPLSPLNNPKAGQTDDPTDPSAKPMGWIFVRGREFVLYRCNQHLEDKLTNPWPKVVAHPVFAGAYQCEKCPEPRAEPAAP